MGRVIGQFNGIIIKVAFNALWLLEKLVIIQPKFYHTEPKQRNRLAFLLGVGLLWGCSADPGWKLLQRLDGPLYFKIQEYGDKIIFINYWAEWCAPCREELPELSEFRAMNLERVEVLGINFDAVAPDKLRQLAEQFDITIPLLIEDPGRQLGWPRPKTLPTTLVVTSQGTLLAVLEGQQSKATLSRVLTSLVTDNE